MKIVRYILIILLTFHISGAFAAIETCSCNLTVQDFKPCCTMEYQSTKKSSHYPVSEKLDDMCNSAQNSEPENYNRSKESCICESIDNYLCTSTTNDSHKKINVPSVNLKYSAYPTFENQFFSTNYEIPFWNNSYLYPSTVSRVYLRNSSLLI